MDNVEREIERVTRDIFDVYTKKFEAPEGKLAILDDQLKVLERERERLERLAEADRQERLTKAEAERQERLAKAEAERQEGLAEAERQERMQLEAKISSLYSDLSRGVDKGTAEALHSHIKALQEEKNRLIHKQKQTYLFL